MGNAERYHEIMETSIRLQQADHEKTAMLYRLGELLTVAELRSGLFDSDSCEKAFALLLMDKDIAIEESTFVDSSLHYKDITIHLHENPDKVSSRAMQQIMQPITPASLGIKK